MPYFISDQQADCDGWATVKDDGTGPVTIGCHASKQDAVDHMVVASLAEDLPPGGERDLNGPAAIVVDIDGTLIAANGDAIENVVAFVDEYTGAVLIVTARMETRRAETIAQLDAIGVDYELLEMRANRTPEVAYKAAVMKNLFSKYNVELAIENNPDVRAEYARIGVTVLAPSGVDPQELPQMLKRALDARIVDLSLPAYISGAAERGLAYYADGLAGDGVVERTIREARLMASGEVSEDKVIRTSAWIARHLVDLEAPANNDPTLDAYPGPGAVAFFLWGVDPLDPEPARAWFDRKAEAIKADATNEAPIRAATIRGMNGDVEIRRVTVNEFELRDAAADSTAGMHFSGYAAVFDSPSEPLPFIERISPGAFSQSLASRNEIKLFVNHDTTRVLASKRSGTLRLSEDAYGLRVEADLPPTTDGNDLAILMRRGDVDSMSFGFSVPSGGDTWSNDGATRQLNEVRLHEVSIVTAFPAYQATTASVRSLDQLAEVTGHDAAALSNALTRLESGEELDAAAATLIESVVDKLRAAPSDDVLGALALKRKQLDLLLARV